MRCSIPTGKRGPLNNLLNNFRYTYLTKDQPPPSNSNLVVCVCVFFPFILDIKFVGRTSRGHTGGRSHRFLIHLSAVRALIFLARRIQPFLSLVDREVEFLCTNDLIVLHPLGIFILVF